MNAPPIAVPAARVMIPSAEGTHMTTTHHRIPTIDILRGLVIIIMALDHVRDYLHVSGYGMNPLDPAQTTPLLYTTRWVTNLCAPVFVLLSGVSAWLQLERGKSRGALARHLLTRGLWLIVLELTLISFAWAWTIPYLIFAQVIWVIGATMILLAGLVFLPRWITLALGIAIIAGHNGLAPSIPALTTVALIPDWLFVAYPLIPWFGVMCLGYGLGPLFSSQRGQDRTLPLIGAGMIALFLVLRLTRLYGEPLPWQAHADIGATIMDFLDVLKYPPSLLFVCATLGPVLLIYPLLARLPASVGNLLRTYGAVPLMAYIAHLFAVHLAGILARLAAGQDIAPMSNAIRNFVFDNTAMNGTGVDFLWVYPAWIAVLAAIYPLCRWWAQVKSARKDWWLSYL
jgi:uncharacterized membrane protein